MYVWIRVYVHVERDNVVYWKTNGKINNDLQCMYICVYVYICIYICMCVYVFVYVYIYLYIYAYIYMSIYIYMYIYICLCTSEYVHVCMRTLVDVNEGPYHPLRFGRRGCCFNKSENTKSDLYTASPYGLVNLQFPHSFDRRYLIFNCFYYWKQ